MADVIPRKIQHGSAVEFSTFVINSDGEVRPLRGDDSTHALICIDYEHHEIHGGSHYVLAYPATLGVSTTTNILIVTPNTEKWLHLLVQAVSTAALTLSLYEAPDYSGGDAQTAYNSNRNSDNTSGATFTSDATDDGSGLGTLLWQFKSGANNRAGTVSRNEEIVLKQNTKYLIKLDGANTNVTTTLLEWYEHTDKS